jgi:ribosome biogenesis GTPase / thiamine phosphate phosphatase
MNIKLEKLGFDRWFQEKMKTSQVPDCRVARVTEVNRDRYLVRNENSEVAAELTGNLMFSAESSMDLPTVGDWVFVQYHNENTFAIIHEMFPRKSLLSRKTPGRKIDYQLIASNIDVAFIAQAADFDFNLRRLERYLVMVNEGGIEPVILLTKSDLISPEKMDKRISEIRQSNINCSVLSLSNKSGLGLDHVLQVLEAGKTYCLIGSSGVGKTTLLNHLIGRNLLETKTVREQDGKGRHTTSRRQMILLEQGSMLIDTPGMRELGSIGVNSGIDESFTDIVELSSGCRFANCTHTKKTGCAVLEAIENGEVTQERYNNYFKLLAESRHYQMSYLEKRKKDKDFGQMIKSVMKHNKKK